MRKKLYEILEPEETSLIVSALNNLYDKYQAKAKDGWYKYQIGLIKKIAKEEFNFNL